MKAGSAARIATKKAEVAHKVDPVGKTVRVKSKGEGCPGRLAKVLSIHTEKFWGKSFPSLTLGFLRLDGMFVSKVDEGFRLLSAVVDAVLQAEEGNSNGPGR